MGFCKIGLWDFAKSDCVSRPISFSDRKIKIRSSESDRIINGLGHSWGGRVRCHEQQNLCTDARNKITHRRYLFVQMLHDSKGIEENSVTFMSRFLVGGGAYSLSCKVVVV